jgi:hypothetical protein
MGLIGFWGVLGFVALLIRAIMSLAPLAIDAVELGLNWWQWLLCVFYSLFMIYSEGYKGFHLQTAPRVVVRALYLSANPRPLHAILAPVFCMGLFHASKKRLIVSWAILTMIVLLVIGVRFLPQPWRGIVDSGVVLGLALGTLSILYFLGLALLGRPIDASPDLPDGAAA